MKIIYKDGTVAECPQEEELHVLRHTAARSLTTAERGGEPPPGTARYSRLERRFPLLKQGAIWVEPWSFSMLHPL